MNTIHSKPLINPQALKEIDKANDVKMADERSHLPSSNAVTNKAVSDPVAGEDLSKQLRNEVKDLNQKFQNSQSELRFEIDKESGRTVIKVVDVHKGEVIKQIPSDSFLAQSARIRAFLDRNQQGFREQGGALGLLLNKKA